MQASMDQHKIVPDILDVAPPENLEVTYSGGFKVLSGNVLTPTQVKDMPHISWRADPNQLYTLLMTDPDAPSRDTPTYREIRHWLVINIPGKNILDGQVLVDYRGSGPPKDTGFHRYVFLVFPQNIRIESNMFISNRTRDGRLRTSTRKLIKDFNLQNPIAGNFYQAQYDDYVPIAQQQYTK